MAGEAAGTRAPQEEPPQRPPCTPRPRWEQAPAGRWGRAWGRAAPSQLSLPPLPARPPCSSTGTLLLVSSKNPTQRGLTFLRCVLLLLLVQPRDIPKRGAGVKDGLQDGSVVHRGHDALCAKTPRPGCRAQAGGLWQVNVHTAGTASPFPLLSQPGREAPPPGQLLEAAAQLENPQLPKVTHAHWLRRAGAERLSTDTPLRGLGVAGGEVALKARGSHPPASFQEEK